MTTVFLFCTADVPARTINECMTAVAETFEGPNMLSLIRTPDREKVDEWGTQPLVEDFTTGFKSASDTKLRLYTRNQIEELKSTGDEEFEDAGVEYHVPEEADVSENEIWWKWRVKFTDAFQLFLSLNDGDFRAMQWYTRPEGYGPDGVYNVDIARKFINGEMSERG